MFLQHSQIELHHVPTDDHIRIVVGKPGVEFFQQLRAAGDVFQFEIKRGGVAILRPQHINDALPAAFQADAVQLTVAGGFNIYRNPLERRTIVGMRFQTGINDSAIAYITLDPHWRGDKTLHQIAFWRAHIGLVNGNATFTQALFVIHQLAMGATVKAIHRLAVKIL